MVHCYQGKSRSVAIIMAYLIIKHGFSVESSLERIRLVRPLAEPNTGFLSALRALELEAAASSSSGNSESIPS